MGDPVTPPRFPRTNYAAIYRANLVPPPAQVRVHESPDFVVTLIPGPFCFRYPVPQYHHASGSTSVTLGAATQAVGEGCYLAISHLVNLGASPAARAQAALPLAELVTCLALVNPGLLAEKIYEGVLDQPGTQTFFPEGPLTIGSPLSLAPTTLTATLGAQTSGLRNLEPTCRGRRQLASRWYLRGHDARNPIDRLLFWFITLEVFPAAGTTDVVAAVRDMLHTHVYPDLSPPLVKERCGIGRITGLRAQVVHDGLSYIDLPADRSLEASLEQLEAIVTVSLRLLLGLPPGDALDRWLRT
jgi:hypothetical protein